MEKLRKQKKHVDNRKNEKTGKLKSNSLEMVFRSMVLAQNSILNPLVKVETVISFKKGQSFNCIGSIFAGVGEISVEM